MEPGSETTSWNRKTNSIHFLKVLISAGLWCPSLHLQRLHSHGWGEHSYAWVMPCFKLCCLACSVYLCIEKKKKTESNKGMESFYTRMQRGVSGKRQRSSPHGIYSSESHNSRYPSQTEHGTKQVGLFGLLMQHWAAVEVCLCAIIVAFFSVFFCLFFLQEK